MKRKVVVILLAVMLSVMVVFGVTYKTNETAAATTPVSAPLDNIVVCPVPRICATVAAPTVTLPGVTVTRLVTLNPVTVRVPPVTLTRIISLPPVVRTILVPVNGGTRTVTVGLPQATTTATVVINKEVIRNGTAPPVTREVRSTVPAGQTTVMSGTVVPSKEVVRIPGTTKTVTKFQAIGLSLLGLLALMGLGWFLLWLGFVLGYRSSEKENVSFLRALRDTIRRTPGKHE